MNKIKFNYKNPLQILLTEEEEIILQTTKNYCKSLKKRILHDFRNGGFLII